MTDRPITTEDLRAVLAAEAQDIPDPALERDNLLHQIIRRPRRVSRRRRAGLILAVCSVVVLAVGLLIFVQTSGSGDEGAGEPPADSHQIRWTTFENRTFGFDVSYPSDWHAEYFQMDSSFTSAVAFFSTEEMTDPCHQEASGTSVCDSVMPIKKLPPDGLVISWFQKVFPGVANPFSLAPGKRIRIDSLPAKVDISSANAVCRTVGGATSIEATIQTSTGFFAMSACLGSENQERNRVLRALRSARFG